MCDHLLAISPQRPGSLYAALETLAMESSRSVASGEQPEIDDLRWQRRLEIGKALRAVAPATRACMVRIATDLIGYASHMCDASRVDEARAAAEDARSITAELAALDPEGADVASTWEFLYGVLARIAAQSGCQAEQRRWLLELCGVLEGRLRSSTAGPPQRFPDRVKVARVRSMLAELDAAEGGSDKAAEGFNLAIGGLLPDADDPDPEALLATIAALAAHPPDTDWASRSLPALAQRLGEHWPGSPSTAFVGALAMKQSGRPGHAAEMLRRLGENPAIDSRLRPLIAAELGSAR
jgi:hypothetical protein